MVVLAASTSYIIQQKGINLRDRKITYLFFWIHGGSYNSLITSVSRLEHTVDQLTTNQLLITYFG